MTIAQREVFKKIRVIVQLMVIAAVAYWLYGLVYDRRTPTKPDKSRWVQRRGFVALSYIALARTDHENAVSRANFERQMAALRRDGWTSITTEDVIDYYLHNAPLPEKAVYLVFENGRKDNAIFGQEGLATNDFRGAMYVPTGRMKDWNRLVLRPMELARLAKNPFWDVQSQGHESDPINVTPDGYYSYYLTDYLRDRNDKAIETPAQYRERAAKDYDTAVKQIEHFTGRKPRAYLFMPGNTLWNSLPKEIETANEVLLIQHFDVAFAGSGPCFNSRESNRYDLTRMQVQPNWDARRLLDEIQRWLPARRPYRQSRDAFQDLWCVDRGKSAGDAEALSLSVEKGRPAFAWLRGSVHCAAVEATMGFAGGAEGGQYCFLRYAARDAYLRLGVVDGRLRVQERIPQRGLVTLLDRPWTDDPKARLHAKLKGDRLWLALDGKPLLSYPIAVTSGLRQGRLGLGAEGADGYTARFAGLEFQPLEERWDSIPADLDAEQLLARAADPAATCLLVPVGGMPPEAAVTKELPKFLVTAAQSGTRTLALLPPGSVDLEGLSKPLAGLPAALANRLWGGVVMTPTRAPFNGEALEKAVALAKGRDLTVALRLNAAAAQGLNEYLSRKPSDKDPVLGTVEVLLEKDAAANAALVEGLRNQVENVMTAHPKEAGVFINPEAGS